MDRCETEDWSNNVEGGDKTMVDRIVNLLVKLSSDTYSTWQLSVSRNGYYYITAVFRSGTVIETTQLGDLVATFGRRITQSPQVGVPRDVHELHVSVELMKGSKYSTMSHIRIPQPPVSKKRRASESSDAYVDK